MSFCYKDCRAKAPYKNRNAVAIAYLKLSEKIIEFFRIDL